MISYAVVGHRSRRKAAEKLAASVGGSLSLDLGETGSNANHDLAWGMFSESADWHVVLEDDAVIPEGFLEAVPRALSQTPSEGAVSFYTGTGRPRPTAALRDRKSTRLNSSHVKISYAVFC